MEHCCVLHRNMGTRKLNEAIAKLLVVLVGAPGDVRDFVQQSCMRCVAAANADGVGVG
jgi:hypothetical protein